MKELHRNKDRNSRTQLVSPTNAPLFQTHPESKISSKGAGTDFIETGWKTSVIAEMRNRKGLIPLNQESQAYVLDNDKGTIELAESTKVINLPYYNYGWPLLTNWGKIKFNFNGIGFDVLSGEGKDTIFKTNKCAEQVFLAATNIMTEIIAKQYTDLSITSYTPTFKIDNKYPNSVFPAFMFAFLINGMKWHRLLLQKSRLKAFLNQLNNNSSIIYNRINLLLAEFNRSYIITAEERLAKILPTCPLHAKSLDIVRSALALQVENKAMNNTISYTDIDTDNMFGLNNDQLKMLLTVFNGSSTVELLTDNIPQQSVDVIKDDIIDFENLLKHIYTDIDSNTWKKTVEAIGNYWVTVINHIAQEIDKFTMNLKDFNAASNVLPSYFTSVLRIYNISDIEDNMILSNNEFEQMYYTKSILWRATPLNSGSNTVFGVDQSDFEATIRANLIDAVVPNFYNLEPDTFFDSNAVLYMKNDYNNGSKVQDVYLPVIDLTEFYPRQSFVLLPKKDENSLHSTFFKWDIIGDNVINVNTKLCKITYAYQAVNDTLLPRNIPIIPRDTTVAGIKGDTKPTTITYCPLETYSHCDLGFYGYIQSTFLMAYLPSISNYYNTKGSNYNAIILDSVPLFNKVHNGFRPVSYKPIEKDMINNAASGLGVKPIISYGA